MSADYDYSTDWRDAPWELLPVLLPERTWRQGGPGRPPYSVRRIVNGILYVNKMGCQWRMVKAFDPWRIIYGYCYAGDATASRHACWAAPVGAPISRTTA